MGTAADLMTGERSPLRPEGVCRSRATRRSSPTRRSSGACTRRGLFHTDLFVEMDRTFKPAKSSSRFERYEPPNRLGAPEGPLAKYLNTLPLVVFVRRDEESAREFCRAADPVVTACHSYAGEYPGEWDHAGRERMFFVAERAIHEGSLQAYAAQGFRRSYGWRGPMEIGGRRGASRVPEECLPARREMAPDFSEPGEPGCGAAMPTKRQGARCLRVGDDAEVRYPRRRLGAAKLGRTRRRARGAQR
jgi:hypothetical protein